MKNRDMKLKHPYLPVHLDAGDSYGGSQMWFANKTMKGYGCGVIGGADVLMYLGLHRHGCRTDYQHGMEHGILHDSYERYILKMRRRYFPLLPFLGMPGYILPIGMNRYFRYYGIRLRARWGVWPWKLLESIEDMLSRDIPVVLAIGPNFPILWGKKNLNFYRKSESYIYAGKTRAHFVTVTGIEDGYLRISSWGRELYISWEEYKKYVLRYSNYFLSNICYIKEK